MDAQEGQMASYELAVSLANHLKSLTALDSVRLQDTVDQVLVMLPLDIRIYRHGRELCISLGEAPADSRMSLQSILYRMIRTNSFDNMGLNLADSENEAPSADTSYHSDSELYLLDEINDVAGFDWDGWLDDDYFEM